MTIATRFYRQCTSATMSGKTPVTAAMFDEAQYEQLNEKAKAMRRTLPCYCRRRKAVQ